MNLDPTKPSTRSLLSRLTHSLDTFRALRDEAPLHMLVVFLHIGQRRGIGAAELGRLTGLSQASVSRNVHALGRGKGQEPGLGLVSQAIDPNNPRAHVIRLTAKGAALARELVGGFDMAVPGDEGASLRPQLEKAEHLHWQNWID